MVLTIKRIAIAVISLLVGYGSTLLIVKYVLETVPSDYGATYIILTTLSIAAALAVWLDKFLKTDLLPE